VYKALQWLQHHRRTADQLPDPAMGHGKCHFQGVLAPIFYVSNSGGVEQITVQVPFETQPGTVNVTINSVVAEQPRAATGATVRTGVFESFYGNQKVAVATRPDGSVVSPTNRRAVAKRFESMSPDSHK